MTDLIKMGFQQHHPAPYGCSRYFTRGQLVSVGGSLRPERDAIECVRYYDHRPNEYYRPGLDRNGSGDFRATFGTDSDLMKILASQANA